MRIEPGDCLEVMARLAADGVRAQSVVTDPPYHLTSIVKRFGADNASPATGVYGRSSKGFMGKQWDGGDIAFRPETWRLAWELLPPGGHLLAFSSTRTYHRIACAIEDAGFEIRDQIGWAYGSGFPKSHDVAKQIDKQEGGVWRSRVARALPSQSVAKQWDGWGTALKPAWEPICVARKPLDGTVAANVLAHGTGALNIDACRVEFASSGDRAAAAAAAAKQKSRQVAGRSYEGWGMEQQLLTAADYAAGAGGQGRWPANLVHDGGDEVLAGFPRVDTQRATVTSSPSNVYGGGAGQPSTTGTYGHDESGSAARFFYTAKATAEERLGSKHPTVKPVALMRWLVRLVTPPGGTVLDPFAGSGTTGVAAQMEGFDSILIEREAEYLADIKERIANLSGASDRKDPDQPTLFGRL